MTLTYDVHADGQPENIMPLALAIAGGDMQTKNVQTRLLNHSVSQLNMNITVEKNTSIKDHVTLIS